MKFLPPTLVVVLSTALFLGAAPCHAGIRLEARLAEQPDYRKKLEAEAPALIDKANARLQEFLAQEKALAPLDDKPLDAKKQQAIFVEKVVALRERADQLVLQRRYAVARLDYGTAAMYAHRITGFQKDREADCYVDKAFCGYQLHRFEEAAIDLKRAERARDSIKDDFEFLSNLARVQVATEQFDAAIATCQRMRARIKELVKQANLPGLEFGADKYDFEKANSYVIESGARFLQGDALTAYAQWCNSDPARVTQPNPFNVQQVVLNAAIAQKPKDVEARLKRARFFQQRAQEQRKAVADLAGVTFATTASRFNSGGIFNRIEIENLDVHDYTFDEAALYDYSKARQLRADAATLTGHFLSAKSFNTKAPKGRAVSAQSLRIEASKIQRLGHRDAAWMREIGLRLSEIALSLPDGDPSKREELANATSYFSFALFAAPRGADAADNRAQIKKLISARFQMTPAATPEKAPQTALEWKQWGNQALSELNERVALAAYADAIALSPQYADAYNNRGNVYLAMGHLEAALEAFDKAIALNAKHVIAYHNRAMLWNALLEPQKASDDEAKAVEFAPDDAARAGSLAVRARLFRDANQLATALEEAQKATALAPDQTIGDKHNLASTWAIRAEIELEMGDDKAALASLKTAQVADDKNRRSGFLLALLLNLSPTTTSLNDESKKMVETLLPYSGGDERQTFWELTERFLKNSPTLRQNPNAPAQVQQLLDLIQRYEEEKGL